MTAALSYQSFSNLPVQFLYSGIRMGIHPCLEEDVPLLYPTCYVRVWVVAMVIRGRGGVKNGRGMRREMRGNNRYSSGQCVGL